MSEPTRHSNVHASPTLGNASHRRLTDPRSGRRSPSWARARLVLAVLVITLGSVWGGTSLATEPAPSPATTPVAAVAPSADPGLSLTWSDGVDLAPRFDAIFAEATIAERLGPIIGITLTNGQFTEIPDWCTPSPVNLTRSFISASGERLFCVLRSGAPGRTVRFPVRVDGDPGTAVSATLTTRTGASGTTGARTIAPSTTELDPDLRLVSSPDFLNADVADLNQGPNRWSPRRSANSTNGRYERALDQILDEWKALDPAAVLVAGDLVDGRWGADDQSTGNFGPVDTQQQRVRALQSAARTYYPQWRDRFTTRGLLPLPAMGDHEYGDNSWNSEKRALAPTFKEEFADHFTRTPSGSPLFADRPDGPHEFSAWAVRPTPDIQLITLDVFDITRERARIQVDRQQMQWLERVLAGARRDGVTWIVVQGHTPILGPVPTRASSGLVYTGGAQSPLWRLFDEYDVDLYLNGEAHDLSVRERDGITQITHGGLFQYGLTHYLVLDFLDDAIVINARDFSVSSTDSADGTRLWETRRTGMPKNLRIRGESYTIGTALLTDGQGLTARSGALALDR